MTKTRRLEPVSGTCRFCSADDLLSGFIGYTTPICGVCCRFQAELRDGEGASEDMAAVESEAMMEAGFGIDPFGRDDADSPAVRYAQGQA